MKQRSKIILIVDDDPEDRELLGAAIADIDPNICINKLTNGKDAMEYLQACAGNTTPNAIVVDYNMPFATGVEVLSSIQSNPVYSSIPKFVWSTCDTSFHEEASRRSGATNYFIKPSSSVRLYEVAKEILASVY